MKRRTKSTAFFFFAVLSVVGDVHLAVTRQVGSLQDKALWGVASQVVGQGGDVVSVDRSFADDIARDNLIAILVFQIKDNALLLTCIGECHFFCDIVKGETHRVGVVA